MNNDLTSQSKLANEIPVSTPQPITPDSVAKEIEGIKTMREIEKTNYKKSINSPTVGEIKEPAKKHVGLKFSGKKALFIFASLVALLFLCAILAIYTNFDTAFSDLKLEGTVLNSTNTTPVNSAEIYVNDELKFTTSEDGKYRVTDLKQGKYKIRIQASGFRTQEVEVGMGNAFFSYTTKKDFLMEPASTATITGSFLGDIDHDFTDDYLELNNKQYQLAKNGTFSASDVTDGSVKLIYKSLSYLDIEKTIQVNTSSFNLEPIVLVPAGDITGDMQSFLKEEIVTNAKVTVESVNPNQISISEDGKLTVRDLEIGKTYKLRVEASGYETRDYEIEIIQGENKLFNLSIAETGTAYYFKFREEGKEYNIFSSDYDGIDEKQLTNDPKLEPFNLYFDKDENKLYLQTQKDRATSTIRDQAGLIYTLDLSNNSLNKVTTSTTNLGNVIPNFKAKKAINLTKGSETKSRILQIMDLDGSNRNDLKALSNGTIDNIFLSDDGSSVYFVENDIAKNKYGLYHMNISDKSVKTISNNPEIVVLDISSDGKRVLFSSKNETTDFKDLQIYTTTTSELKTLKANYSGFQYQFATGSNDTILYFDKRSEVDNIYSMNVDSLSEQKITDLREIDKINNIYQQNSLLYYITQRGLNILDLSEPKTGKIVQEGVFNAI